MTVVQYQPPPPLPASQPGDELEPGPRGWVARLRGAAEYAGYIANTDFVPANLRGNPPAIAAAILYGAEVGLEPMQSLAKIAVIKGRPTLTAEAIRSLVLSAGHELWLEESTVTRAIAAGRRSGSERIGRVTWTLDDAKRAGIGGGQNWRSYPREMLVARATAALARQMFADVIGGLAAAEEAIDDADNNAIPPPSPAPPPVKPATTRRRRTSEPEPPPAPPVPPTPPPDPQPEPEPPAEPPVTDAQMRHMFALMRDLGIEARDDRLAYAQKVIGREVPSSGELTLAEASRILDQLTRELEQRQQEQLVQEAQAVFSAEEIPFDGEPPA